jgi:hypothetical protein
MYAQGQDSQIAGQELAVLHLMGAAALITVELALTVVLAAMFIMDHAIAELAVLEA